MLRLFGHQSERENERENETKNEEQVYEHEEYAMNGTSMSSSSEEETRGRKDILISLAGAAGNMLEWYDFAVFGFFSEEIGENFFAPNQTGNLALVETFAVYGLAFLVRPIGGAIIGKMGDTSGRKGALELSIFLMACPTFLIGCLPTYEMVGPLSTVLLILMRILQGLSVGGQKMASVIFTLERSPVSTWGFWGSVVFAVANVGVSIASLFASIIHDNLTEEQIQVWGWRIPFWFGLFGALPAVYLKMNAKEEAIVPTDLTKEKESNTELHLMDQSEITSITTWDPLKESLSQKHRRSLIAAILIPTLDSAAHYILFVWLVIFMTSILDPPIPHAFNVNAINGFLGGVVLALVGGWITDWARDYTMTMYVSGIFLTFLAPVGFVLLVHSGDHPTLVAFLTQIVLTSFSAVWTGALVPWIILLFPPEIRLTSVSLAFNISISIWGGFAPLVSTILADRVSLIAPGFLVMVAGLFSLFGLWLGSKEFKNRTDHIFNPSLNSENNLQSPLLA